MGLLTAHQVWNPDLNTFVSCAVFIEGIERVLYVAPRASIKNADGTESTVDINSDVIPEVQDVIRKTGIKKMR